MTGVLVFLAGVYGTTWALSLLLRAPAAAGSTPAVLAFVFGSVWAPTVIALLVVRFVERQPVAAFLRQRLRTPQVGGWFVAAAIVPVVVTAIAVLVSRTLGHSAPFAPLSTWPSILALQVATGATGEELGWRGYLVSRLAARLGLATASLASGVLWSAWHLAGVALPHSGLDVVPLAPFLLSAALFGALLAILFARSRGNVLAPMLAHLSLNVTLGLRGTSPEAQPFWWSLALGTAVATGIAALTAGRLTLTEAPDRR